MKNREFKFKDGKGKVISFKVKHNLGKNFGVSIDGAFDNWYYRTKDYSVQSFCEYVKSKQKFFDETIVCEPQPN